MAPAIDQRLIRPASTVLLDGEYEPRQGHHPDQGTEQGDLDRFVGPKGVGVEGQRRDNRRGEPPRFDDPRTRHGKLRSQEGTFRATDETKTITPASRRRPDSTFGVRRSGPGSIPGTWITDYSEVRRNTVAANALAPAEGRLKPRATLVSVVTGGECEHLRCGSAACDRPSNHTSNDTTDDGSGTPPEPMTAPT